MKNQTALWTLSTVFSMIETDLKLQKSDSTSSNKYMNHYFSPPKLNLTEN